MQRAGTETTGIAVAVEESAAARGIVLDAEQRALLDEVAAFLEGRVESGGETAGFYVHGPAGRGKTWLMSEIFRAAPLPESRKRRVHFHTFFQELQRRFGARMSARAAIEETVEELLSGAQLFFFDELHVHDPGGASLLNRLLDELTRRGVPTLLTSNYEPEGLLPNPVYHHVFVPGIRIIRERFAVRVLDGGADYRRAGGSRSEAGFGSGRWLLSSDESAIREAGLALPDAGERTTVLHGHRALHALAARGSEIWFDFSDLLEATSIAEDYLDLTANFDSWVLSGVPPLSRASREARQRFVALLDVLVHADLPLTVLAETDRAGLVDIEDPPADLFRAESRLALLRGA
ncbi:cell division protein ZapE [Leucobacter celer]|jgi:cell division protein ZapE|uniref:cell division protein ZapE n=1 Tax=Leucobacter celer TaxID=668625 RepID=UPI0006A7D3FB|nr:cell division protein ZapE [Leucobacter celer]